MQLQELLDIFEKRLKCMDDFKVSDSSDLSTDHSAQLARANGLIMCLTHREVLPFNLPPRGLSRIQAAEYVGV